MRRSYLQSGLCHKLGCTVHLRGFIRPLSCICYCLGSKSMSFFNPLTLQMSELLLFSFISVHRPGNSLLSSSPSYNNSLTKADNENQHILQIICFLDSSSRADSLQEDLSYYKWQFSHVLPLHTMDLISPATITAALPLIA